MSLFAKALLYGAGTFHVSGKDMVLRMFSSWHANIGKPIPLIRAVDGWKEIPIKECGEPLVPIGPFSDYPEIATDAIYIGERISSPYKTASINGSLMTVFVRAGIANRLRAASKLLPPQYMLLVWDAYRPLSVQQSLFDYFVDVLVDRGSAREQAMVEAQKFVSIPSEDPTRPPPHSTGAAVDVTLIWFEESEWKEMKHLTAFVRRKETSANWQELYRAEMRRQQLIRFSRLVPMGTVFDEVCDQTETRYFELAESIDEAGCRAGHARRILFNVMRMAGFSNYDAEWWHYQYGNQFHTAITGEPAIYARAEYSDDNRRHENMRRRHYQGTLLMSERRHPGSSGKGVEHEYFPFVSAVAMKTGHPRHTTHAEASAI